MDLRHEFSDIISEYGSKYLHLSRKDTACKCVNKNYEVAKDDCIICLGTGKPIIVKIVSGRVAIASSTLSLPVANQSTIPGKIHSESKVFFLYDNEKVHISDFIIECDFDKNSIPIINKNIKIFTVNESVPSRGDNGRIEYNRIWATSDPLNSHVKLNNLKQRMKKM